MKKFLSMVLALVMVMSLVTVSAGAKDFTDNSSITYKEAVDVVSEIGIVDGYEDGAFNPTATLTRGAAAKIICNLILGPTTADALRADTAPYSDVPTSNTFAGYIAYCQQQGIISGYADGTFRPAATLTGYAFMKMLLGALGYDSSIEGLTGANWSVQVGKLALGISLDDGNDEFVGTQAVTREEACLYAFNTLKATMVEYGSKTTVEVNGATVNVGGGDYSDVANTTSTDGNIENDDKMQFAERYFTNLSKTRNTTDAFGRPANEWRYRANVIGSYADYSDLKASYTAGVNKGDLYTLVGSSIVNGLADEYDLTVYVDGEDYRLTASRVGDFFDRNSSATAALTNVGNPSTRNQSTGRGVLTEVFVDDDSNVTIVMVNTYLMQANADYNTTRESVSVEQLVVNDTLALPALPAVIEQEDFDVSGVKEDDYLLVTYSYDTDDIESVVAAEIVSGTVTQYTERTNVIMDGTTYRYAQITNNAVKDETFTINAAAALVVDAYGYIIYVDDAVTTNSFAYIKEFGNSTGLTTGGNAVAYAYFTDGTEGQIGVEKVDNITSRLAIAGLTGGSTASNTAVLADTDAKWYTYTADSSDRYTLTSIGGANRTFGQVAFPVGSTSAATPIVTNSTVRYTPQDTTLRGNADTIFMVLDTDENVTVYTGVASVPDITLASGVAYNLVKISWAAKNGYAEAVFIDLSLLSDAQVTIDDTADTDLLFVLNSTNNRTVVAGSSYYEYDVVLNGEETTRYINSTMGVAVGRLYYNYRTNSNDYITSGSEAVGGRRERITMTNAAITRSGQTLSIGASDDYIITNDTRINVVVSDDAPALLRDKGADYETYLNTTLGTLAGLVINYNVSGTAYVIVDETGSEVAETVYVYINGAAYTGNTPPPTPSDDETLPNTSDLVVQGQVGGTPNVAVQGRFNEERNELYLQVTGLNAKAAKTTVPITITDNAGKTVMSTYTFEKDDNTSTTSKILTVSYVPRTGATSIAVNATTAVAAWAVDTWYVTYSGTANFANKTETVKNVDDTEFSFTVRKPAGATSFGVANGSSAGVDTFSPNLPATGLTEDVTFTAQLNGTATAPVVDLNVTAASGFTVTAVPVAGDTYARSNGISSADLSVADVPGSVGTSGTNATLDVYLTDAAANTNRIVVNYKVGGVAKAAVTHTCSAAVQQTISLPTGTLSGSAEVEVTSIVLESQVSITEGSSTTNMGSATNTALKNGTAVVTEDDTFVPVGAALTVEVTVGAVANDPVYITIAGGNEQTVPVGTGATLSGTYDVVVGENTIVITASDTSNS